MEYSIFCENVRDEIQRMMGDSYEVKLENVVKNNHVSYKAIVILTKDRNISPSIYLEGYYDEYTEGKNITDIGLDVIVQYEQYKDGMNLQLDDISDYGYIRDKVYVKVINTQMNEQILEKMPSVNYYDLSMVAYAIYDVHDGCSATMNITDTHMNIWNIDKDTLFKDAINNTRRNLQPKVERMRDVMRDLIREKMTLYDYRVGDDEEIDEILQATLCKLDEDDEGNMYVLTNSKKLNGAVYILFNDVLEHIADTLEDDMYILPSSIHEIIIIPKSMGVEYEELLDMVKNVNESELDPKEVLSDSVYMYCRGKGMQWT